MTAIREQSASTTSLPAPPRCDGHRNGRRCGHHIHPAFSSCPFCGRVYLARQIDAAWRAAGYRDVGRLRLSNPYAGG